MVTIEQLSNEVDIQLVMLLCRDSFFDQSVADPERIGKLAEKYANRAEVLRASIDGETVGFAAFYANDAINCIGFLSMIVVRREFQGFGVGREMMNEVLSRSSAVGMKMVRLNVRMDNAAAIMFYKKNGFSVEDCPDSSTFTMIKEL
ncbi:MAG: GNAT family N-acetyltransferase [Clostridiales bacterium]|nr:GNAT family N-acetyltransferase [Clostridiales bacterium]